MSARSGQEAYRALQRLAREQGRNTQQLFELYVHERFLARLTLSRFADRFVLKGGMLLAALDTRRSTRDADLLALDIDNEPEHLRSVVAEIAEIDLADGVTFDPSTITTRIIRDEADYQGVRLTVPAGLGGAELKLKLDLSFGDPVAPRLIAYPTLLDETDLTLLGYPIESVIAEKAETMIFRGDANTRDRDFGDIYSLTGVHDLDGTVLHTALRAVADHRGHQLRPLRESLDTLSTSRQGPWNAFRDRAGPPALPGSFAEVVDAVAAFVDPLVGERPPGRWHAAERVWR